MKYPEIKDRESHRIAVTAIIYNDEGKFLITKRSPHKKVHPNKWTVPGGGMEVDDYINDETSIKGQWYYSIEKTLRREVMEEVNVEIEKPEYFCDVAFIRPDNIPVIVLSYFAKYKSGEVKLDDDAVEYAWISVDEVNDYDFIQGIDQEIKDVAKILEERK